jgi:hypothetical protein
MIAKGRACGFTMIAIGDRKTRDVAWPEGAAYFGLARQRELGFALGAILPIDHYARKNLGYLIAIAERSPVIFDTDDDNAPLDCWHPRPLATIARTIRQSGWSNVYRWFSDAHVWPRGFPLAQARGSQSAPPLGASIDVIAPIQQGLVDGSPDVDAVWRLVMDEDIRFRSGDSVYLPEGAWCPFNSQSTWWYAEAYPLMYLPSHVSFRMTDIWRSFVAQRCLWPLGRGVVFHGPEMFQDRNPHDLMRDFEQEIPGYLANDRIREVLEHVSLPAGEAEVGNNCHRCYDALVQAGFIPAEEMTLVEAWLQDVDRARK